METAWDTTTGSSNVVIAVLDTGIDYTHPDLAGNIWHNPFEIAGNGLDDDGNNYVDDVYGINAVANNGNPLDTDTQEGHGTSVAGVAGAVGNNSIGVAGTCWTVKLMALKFRELHSGGTQQDLIQCYDYMIAMKQRGVNIRVAQIAWGKYLTEQTPDIAVKERIDAAGALGIITVCAAYNQKLDTDTDPIYPQCFTSDYIINVAGSDKLDNRWTGTSKGSNYGATTVDLAAPAVLCPTTLRGGGYTDSANGTSCAVPVVAGTCALISLLHPEASAMDIRMAVLGSVDILSAWSGYVDTSGRLNAAKALLFPKAAPGEKYDHAIDQTILACYNIASNKTLLGPVPCEYRHRWRTKDTNGSYQTGFIQEFGTDANRTGAITKKKDHSNAYCMLGAIYDKYRGVIPFYNQALEPIGKFQEPWSDIGWVKTNQQTMVSHVSSITGYFNFFEGSASETGGATIWQISAGTYKGKAFAVLGAINDKYRANSTTPVYCGSDLGLPVSDLFNVVNSDGAAGKQQCFEGGALYRKGTSGSVYAVISWNGADGDGGAIGRQYDLDGGVTSEWGFPIGDKIINTALNRCEQQFEWGWIYKPIISSSRSFQLPANLSMVALAVTPTVTDPQQVIGFSLNRWARWNPTSGQYIQYPDAQTHFDSSTPGKAYWVKLDQAKTVTLSGSPVNTGSPYTIPLQTGWNMIGNPWESAMAWSETGLQVKSGTVTKTLQQAKLAGWLEDYGWAWSNTSGAGQYVLVADITGVTGIVNSIEPWRGCWLKANQNCELIVPPPSRMSSRADAHSTSGWGFNVRAQSLPFTGQVILGEVENGRDLAVASPPGTPDETVPIRISSIRAGQSLAVDLCQGTADRQVWEIAVTWDSDFALPDGKVVLSWPDLTSVPRDVSLTLVDLGAGVRWYLRTTPAYTFTVSNTTGTRRFQLIAERNLTQALQIMGLRVSPTRTAGASISFTLTKAAMTRLTVRTVSGRIVRTVEAGATRTEGMNTATWDGCDQRGRRLPRGVYLLEIHAQDEEHRQFRAVAPVTLR